MFIAHRGLVNDDNHENTIQALRQALNSDKYVGVETDLRVTKDNYFVLVHDVIYRGKIVKYSNYGDLDGVDRLEDLLRIKTNKILMIEIKDISIDLNKLVKMLNKSKRNIYVMSFNRNVINSLNKYTRSFKIGILNYILNSNKEVLNYDFVCLLNDIITDDLINYFSKKNLEVFIYGIYKKINYQNNLMYIVDEKLISK